MCADRCGITSWPLAASFSASSTVASIPWLGEDVIVTVDAGGRASHVWSAFSRGMTSNFGRATRERSACRWSAVMAGALRLPSLNAIDRSPPTEP